MTLTCHAGHTGSFSVCLTGREIAMLSRWLLRLLRLTSLLTLLSPRITFSALPQYRDPGQVTAPTQPPSLPTSHPPQNTNLLHEIFLYFPYAGSDEIEVMLTSVRIICILTITICEMSAALPSC